MERVIKVGNIDVHFAASAATPMKYRNAFKGEDLFRDLIAIDEARAEAASDAEVFAGIDMGIFERIAYIMSDAPLKGIGLEEWLSQFELMDVMTALPEIMELWEANTDTQTLTEKNTEAIER